MKKLFSTKMLITLILLFAFYGVVQYLMVNRILNPYYQLNLLLLCINIMMAVSLNLVNGFLGQLHLGHAGFMAIGAYTSAAMTTKMGLPFTLALITGAVVTAIVGLAIGAPILRLRGDYLAIATLGFGEIVKVVFVNMEYVGGASGLAGIRRYSNWTWIFFISVITVIIIRNYIRSSHGRAVLSIREDEIAAETMGINITRFKVITFTMAAFFAGLAGALYAHYFYLITPNTFNFLKSIDYLVMVVLGGMGSITGSILAATGLTLISAFLQRFAEVRMIIYALILIAVMIFRPQGLMGTKEFGFSFLEKKERR